MDSNWQLLVDSLRRKKRLLENKDREHEEIKTMLLIPGGAQMGVYGASFCYALHLLGMGKVFDAVVGVSAGAWALAYFLAGQEQNRRGITIFHTEFATKAYINSWRMLWLRHPQSAAVIKSATSTGDKQLDSTAAYEARSQFFVGITRQDGQGILVDAKGAGPDFLYEAVCASSAIPLSGRHWGAQQVNGMLVFDGSIGLPFPVKEAVDLLSPTHILAFLNRPEGVVESGIPWYERFCIPLLRQFSPGLRQGILARHKRFQEGLDSLGELDAHVGLLHPSDMGIEPLTIDAQRIRTAADATVKKTLEAFGQPNLDFELF